MFELLRIADTPQFRFYYKCSQPFCEYEFEAEIENQGQLGVCKASMMAHTISHERPM